jgi:hypothetical protein
MSNVTADTPVFFARCEGNEIIVHDHVTIGYFFRREDEPKTVQEGWITVRADNVADALRIAAEHFEADMVARQHRHVRFTRAMQPVYAFPIPTETQQPADTSTERSINE